MHLRLREYPFVCDILKDVHLSLVVAPLAIALFVQGSVVSQTEKNVIRRAAYELLSFPDTLGKMEIVYVVSHTYNIKVTNSKTRVAVNIPVDVVPEKGINPLTGARAYGFRATFTLEDTGRYVVERSSRFVAESGNITESRLSWQLGIVFPRLLAPLKVDSVYYPGESPFISFATKEFSESKRYRYRIKNANGDSLLGAQGSLADLANLVNDSANVGMAFVVEGLYNGKLFKYVNPRTDSVEQSAWKFSFKAPTLIATGHIWKTAGSDEPMPVFSINLQIARFSPVRFGFTFFNKKDNASSIWSLPRLPKAPSYDKSTPSGIIKDINVSNSYPFVYFEITLNTNLLGRTPIPVTIKLDFEHQYGRTETLAFQARLFK